jgi:Ca-activated chloride channel family protein
MHFAQPLMLNGFILVAALVFFFAWQRRSKKRQIGKFAEDHLSGRLIRHDNPNTENARQILMTLGFCFLVLALARPQWGSRWEQMKRRGLDILIALDVSKSMLSEDIKPSRLERSRLAIKDFIKGLKGDRVGLITFSGDAYLACPLTSDYAGFNLTLDDISVKMIGLGGTDISRAIREARKAYAGAAGKHKILIIITDGENHEGDHVAEAQKAAKDNQIHIYTIGVGTPEGELIPVKDSNQGSFLKSKEGLVVKSRLDETTLEKITTASDGAYLRSAPTEFGLEALYRKKLSLLEKKSYEDKQIAIRQDWFQLFLLCALALFLSESVLTHYGHEERP